MTRAQSFTLFGVVLLELEPDGGSRRFEAQFNGQSFLLTVDANEIATHGVTEALKQAVYELKQGRRGTLFPRP